jgi:transcriptional/translational regulatory protein YebC/TACO1
VNRQLFQLIREAKAQGVPNDNIQRAIQRGSTSDDVDFKEAMYEVGRSFFFQWWASCLFVCICGACVGVDVRHLFFVFVLAGCSSTSNQLTPVWCCSQAYGYGGAGLIINCLTDNTNRAKTEINNVIKKTDVKLASSGSVAFNFDRKGLLEVMGKVEEDQVIEAALEADVEDVESKVRVGRH